MWRYEYSLKDHLGNTRVIFTDSDDNGEPEIIQEADYYPFGMRHDRSVTATNHYLYNGKELNTDLGLDWYDYGARWLDVETGRWSSIDPLAESYASMSPFNYVANNPISNIDPDGRKIEYYGTEKEITKILNALTFQFNTVCSMEYEFIKDKNGANIGVSIHKYIPVKGEENDISQFLSTVVNSPEVTTIKKIINVPRQIDPIETYGGMRFVPKGMVLEFTDQWFTGKWAHSGMRHPSYKYILKAKSFWHDDSEIALPITFEQGLAHEIIHVARKLLGQTESYMKEENEVIEIMNKWREKNNIKKRGVKRKANFFEKSIFGRQQMEERYEYD